MDIARYLIHLASGEPESDRLAPVTPLQIQKLLYYVQGWSLAQRGRPAFDEAIKAWRNGPAVPEVWRALKHRGNRRVKSASGSAEVLSPDDRLFVRGVWERYKRHSAGELWRMTHREPPWRTTRAEAGVEDGQRCAAEIGHAVIRDYFAALTARLAKLVPDALSAENLEQAGRDLAQGRGVDLAEYFTGRGHAL